MSTKHIVITGSTRGIGYGLAKAFLSSGCSVMVSGRRREAVDKAVAGLKSGHETDRIFGMTCDVTVPEQVQTLWDGSVESFGKVDVWVNNAGVSGDQGLVWELPAAEVQKPIATNILGTIYGAQIAMRGMLSQGRGAIYNMEGMGSDGRKHAGLTIYGTSKYAIHYLTEGLALEAKDTPVIIGALRPGMVITYLIVDRYTNLPEEWERVKKMFNIIADSVENVAPWLASSILSNRKNGVILAYSSIWKLLWRFISQPFVKRDLFQDGPPDAT
jgi:NAD(P)-dependent dehydrogenase (short-subunit alcohol dehydrogenase family)